MMAGIYHGRIILHGDKSVYTWARKHTDNNRQLFCRRPNESAPVAARLPSPPLLGVHNTKNEAVTQISSLNSVFLLY